MSDILSFVDPDHAPQGRRVEEIPALATGARYARVNIHPDNDNDRGQAIRSEGNFLIKRPSFHQKNVQLFVKRLIDVVIAFASLAFLAPTLIIIAVIIRLESPGLPLFSQERTGFRGRNFRILKFRSMYTDRCDPTGVIQTIDDDYRVTRFGRFLRRTNLDELPQLWNVLIGDMSLVGPRPHVPGMLAAGKPYNVLVVGYEYRHMMRPGLTGLAQSRGLRGPTVDRWKSIRRVVCDVEYVKSFSLALDFKIAVKTIVNELRGGTGS